MDEYNCDLHFHGPYAGGVSKNMTVPVIAEQAKLKGLQVVSTSDILHKKWFEHVKREIVEEGNGIFRHRNFGTYFIVGTEVSCQDNVHHLIYLPDFARAEELREKLRKFGDLDGIMSGRPRLKLNAEALAALVCDSNGIIGPSHAFTPYFGVYAHFDSVQKAYGELGKNVHFIELGLSADSYWADLIEENHRYSFLTCSDSHSPWPHRIGREFTRMKMEKPDFGNLKKALFEKEEKKITLNAGLNPKEGKYHCTACSSCFTKFSMEQAGQLKWRCLKCKSAIKRGVRDRIKMLANFSGEKHPSFRPKYLHLLPLAEIIQAAVGVNNVNTQKVQAAWRDFVDKFGNEIKILVDVPEEELREFNAEIGKKIIAFRKGWVHYIPGGGGNYGKPIICDSAEEFERKAIELKDELAGKSDLAGQKTLGEF